MQPMIIDITAENFQEMVVQNSFHIPVLVDFWAPWCEPCKQVMPMLEKLAGDLAGRFILAKINTEEQQELAEQFQIRSIPSFKIFHQGSVVEDLQGAQPSSAFVQALEKYMPTDESEELRQAAQQAFSEDNYDQALALLQKAAQANPNNFKVHLDLVKMYFQRGHLEQAKQLLDKLPDEAKQSIEGRSLLGLLRFTEMIADAPPIEAVQKTLSENPNDAASLYALSGYLMLHNHPEKAMQTLLKLFSVDREFRDGAAKKTLLEIFEILQGEQPELVNQYRRKLQNLLF